MYLDPPPSVRDAEMTIKKIFERSGQNGGRFIVGLNHRKNSIFEILIFIVVAFSQEIQ